MSDETLNSMQGAARKALASSWSILKPFCHWSARALVWSWPVVKLLYRGGYFVAAYGFLCLWLWCIGGEPGFANVAAEFVADLRELGLMAAGSLGHACQFVVFMLSRLPVIAGVPVAALIASYVLYGIARTGRPRRAQ